MNSETKRVCIDGMWRDAVVVEKKGNEMGIRNSEHLVVSNFTENEDGWPTGGTTEMLDFIKIRWQDGIIGEEGQNGAFIEDVLEAARQRLQWFQTQSSSCRENAIALTHLETALAWLDLRTRNRIMQGVENTYERH